MKALKKSLEQESNFLNSHLDQELSIKTLINFIRTLDYVYIANYPDKQKWDMLMNYGFPIILNRAYQKIDLNVDFIPLFKTTQIGIDYCFNNLKAYGHYRFVERYLEMAYYGLVDVLEIKENEFVVEFDQAAGIADGYELMKIGDYFETVKKAIGLKIEQLNFRERKIQKQFYKKIFLGKNNFIGYDTNPEIDNFYSQKGYIRLVTSQLFDDFDESFEFGGIPYKQFLDIVSDLMGVTLKHVDACVFLYQNKNVDLIDLLPTCYILEDIIDQYAIFLNIPIDNVRKIFDLLTISPDNIIFHLKSDKSFSPPFIKIGNKYVIRSIKGCLHHPVMFLHKALSEKYSADYSRGLNNREDTFRKNLYSLFEDGRIVKIDRSIRIKMKSAGIETDIDAILFDTKTKNLALIQLKWQDKYSTDLKERNSRADNFYKKANEWVDKIEKWKELNTDKQILNALGIKGSKFNQCYIFVIGRYNTHFYGKEMDERATWGSWYHIFDLSYKIKTDFDDPIRELKFKLEIDSPRKKRMSIPSEESQLYTFKIKSQQRK